MRAPRLVALGLVMTLAAACGGAAASPAPTAGPTATASVSPLGSPVSSPAGSPAVSPVGSPSAATISALAGKWSVTATNPRVVVATGGAAGGTVTIEGTRFTFQAGSYKSSGPIDFAGDVTLDCNTTRCRMTAANPPMFPPEIRSIDGRIVIVNAATFQPYGTGTICGHPSLPGAGVITVSRTTTVDGKEAPAEVTLTGGTSGGVGNECSSSGYQVAWDLKGTRQPG